MFTERESVYSSELRSTTRTWRVAPVPTGVPKAQEAFEHGISRRLTPTAKLNIPDTHQTPHQPTRVTNGLLCRRHPGIIQGYSAHKVVCSSFVLSNREDFGRPPAACSAAAFIKTRRHRATSAQTPCPLCLRVSIIRPAQKVNWSFVKQSLGQGFPPCTNTRTHHYSSFS